MSQKAANPSVNTIRDAFRHVDVQKTQAVREAYYKAVEGLQSLADALEIADLEVGETNDHALIGEHLLACEAIEMMNKSLLGRIL